MKKGKKFWLLGVGLLLIVSVGFLFVPESSPSLPDCSKVFLGPLKPLERDVATAALKYYQAKKLSPIKIYKNQEKVVVVKLWTVGVHRCLNPGGPSGAYVGAVPKNAKSAVQIYVYHKPYVEVPNNSHFLTVAKLPRKGWVVVSETTSP